MDKKQVISAHEWWIDILFFFSFAGFCVILASLTKSLSAKTGLVIGLPSMVAFVFLLIKTKKYIIKKLSDRLIANQRKTL